MCSSDLRYAGGAHSGFVGEGVVGQVAVELIVHARSAQLFFQTIHCFDFEELVLGGPVAHEGRFDLAGVDVVQRGAAVPGDGGVQLGRRSCKQRERAAHAVARDADLLPRHRGQVAKRGEVGREVARQQVGGEPPDPAHRLTH